MKDYVVFFANQPKGTDGKDILEAERYKRTDELYLFYDGDGNVLAQYETQNIVGVRELPPQKGVGT